MRQLGFAPNTYLGWKKKGFVPYLTQLIIEKKTDSRFKADVSHTTIKKKPWEV